jgi:3-oxoacyl-[acyl-carrier-protein] synthase II
MSVTRITGLGLVTPLGATAAATVDAWNRGVVAGDARHQTRTGRPVRVAAVPREDVHVALRVPKLEKYLSWPTTLAVSAAAQAWRAAGRSAPEARGERVGVYAAVGTGALDCDEFLPACAAAWPGDAPGHYGELGGRALRLVDPHFAIRTLANGPAAFVSMELGLKGPSVVFVQSSSASVLAVQAACDDLELGRADAAIVVACDSVLEPTTVLVRERAGVLDGLATVPLGEGAAALVLERDGERPALGGVALAEIFCGASAGEALDALCQRVREPPGHGRATRFWIAVPEHLTSGSPRLEARDESPRGSSFAQRVGDLGAAAPLACAALALTVPGAGADVVVAAEAPDRIGALVLER